MAEELDSIVEFSVDLAKQDAPEPLPVGRYLASIRKATRKESQRGTMYGEIFFHIGAEQYPADFKDGGDDGVTIVYRRVGLEDTPQARYGTRRFIEAIGGVLDKKIDMNEWIGIEAAVDVTHELWEGVNQARITRVQAA